MSAGSSGCRGCARIGRGGAKRPRHGISAGALHHRYKRPALLHRQCNDPKVTRPLVGNITAFSSQCSFPPDRPFRAPRPAPLPSPHPFGTITLIQPGALPVLHHMAARPIPGASIATHTSCHLRTEVARPLRRNPPESTHEAERFRFDVAPQSPVGPRTEPHGAIFRRSSLGVRESTAGSGSAVQFRPTSAADSAESATKLEVLGPFSSTSRHFGARHRPRAGRTCTGSSQGPRNHGKRQRETGYRRRTRRVADVGGVEEAGSGRRGVRAGRDGDGGRGAGGEKRCESRKGP